MFDTAGAATCTGCAAAVQAGSGAIPWERRGELGTVPAFLQTVKVVLLRPQECLAPPPASPGMGPALWFALICQMLGMLFAVLWQVATTLITTASFGGGVGIGELLVMAVVGLFAGPFAAVYWVFLWGGVVHLLLMLFGGARGGFEASARVQGYASATALLNVIPFVGGMIGMVWSLVVQIVGLGAAHQSGYGRSAAAVLTPLLVCCGLAAGLMVLAVSGFSELPNQ